MTQLGRGFSMRFLLPSPYPGNNDAYLESVHGQRHEKLARYSGGVIIALTMTMARMAYRRLSLRVLYLMMPALTGNMRQGHLKDEAEDNEHFEGKVHVSLREGIGMME